jgi:hypothetical protein
MYEESEKPRDEKETRDGIQLQVTVSTVSDYDE